MSSNAKTAVDLSIKKVDAPESLCPEDDAVTAMSSNAKTAVDLSIKKVDAPESLCPEDDAVTGRK